MKNHTITPKIVAIPCDTDIAELGNRPEGSVSEKELMSVLRRYNLRDGLITLGKASHYIFNSGDPNNIGIVAHREPQTGIIITQFALAYLANLLLISKANDYKSKYLSKKDNWLILCNIYNSSLIQPEITETYKITDEDKLRSFMIRLHFEQMEYQFSPIYMMGRTVVIFNDLINKIPPGRFENLSIIFEKEISLSIYDYLRIAAAVAAGSKRTATFNIQMFTNADIPQLKGVLIEEKINKFLKILKADYETIKKEDITFNQNLNPILTKTRFNPLLVYPIIETDAKHLGDPFVVPNISAYIRKAFGGIYWLFHRYFEDKGQQQEFRNYFGYVFQEYVGLILKGIYGKQNVHPELDYPKGKFVDWWVERGDKIYLFEAKANQFALQSKQTGDKDLIVKGEIKKIADATAQVFKRAHDIPKYNELSQFNNKKVLPCIVFMDMPLVSSLLYESWIKEALENIEKEKQLNGLKDFHIFLVNIEELELYDELIDKIELEDVFSIIKNNLSEGFLSVIQKAKGSKLRNLFLDETFKDFRA